MRDTRQNPRLALGLLLGAALAWAGCGRSETSPILSGHRMPIARPQQGGSTGGAPDTVAGELIVQVRSGGDDDQVCGDHNISKLAGLADGRACRVLVPTGRTSQQLTAELSLDTRVVSVRPNLLMDTPESRQSSVGFNEGFKAPQEFWDQDVSERLGLPQAHALTLGSGVLVAILDTGIDPSHVLFQNRIDPRGWDYVAGDANPTDGPTGTDSNGNGIPDEAAGHGSHVAGLVLLVAPQARLLPMRVLDSDGRGNAFVIATAIEDAVGLGAKVINLSLGMTSESPVIDEAIEFAHSAGVVVVAAGGNRGAESPEEYPAAGSGAIGVAATTIADTRASFSNYGDYLKLGAPGVALRSAYWDGGYAVWSGTSMSTPLVAGAAAMLIGQHPTWTPFQVLARLQATASPVPPGEQIGAGRLNVAAAVNGDVGQTDAIGSGIDGVKGAGH